MFFVRGRPGIRTAAGHRLGKAPSAGLEGEPGGGRFGAFTPEKGLEEGAAFDLEHAASNLAAVVEFGVLEEVHEAASCAVLGGEAAEDDTAHAGSGIAETRTDDRHNLAVHVQLQQRGRGREGERPVGAR